MALTPGGPLSPALPRRRHRLVRPRRGRVRHPAPRRPVQQHRILRRPCRVPWTLSRPRGDDAGSGPLHAGGQCARGVARDGGRSVAARGDHRHRAQRAGTRPAGRRARTIEGGGGAGCHPQTAGTASMVTMPTLLVVSGQDEQCVSCPLRVVEHTSPETREGAGERAGAPRGGAANSVSQRSSGTRASLASSRTAGRPRVSLPRPLTLDPATAPASTKSQEPGRPLIVNRCAQETGCRSGGLSLPPKCLAADAPQHADGES